MGPFTIAFPCRNVLTATLVYRAETVAHATGVEFSDTRVYVITDAIQINVRATRTATHSQSVKLVAVTIAVTFNDVLTAATVNGARAIAEATNVKFANTIVHVVTNAIGIFVRGARTVTNPQRIHFANASVHVITDAVGIGVHGASSTTNPCGIQLVAVAVASPLWNGVTSTISLRSEAIAYPARIVQSDAVVLFIADAIQILIGGVAHFEELFTIN